MHERCAEIVNNRFKKLNQTPQLRNILKIPYVAFFMGHALVWLFKGCPKKNATLQFLSCPLSAFPTLIVLARSRRLGDHLHQLMQCIVGPFWLSEARELADLGRSGYMILGILLISDINGSLISRSWIASVYAVHKRCTVIIYKRLKK